MRSRGHATREKRVEAPRGTLHARDVSAAGARTRKDHVAKKAKGGGCRPANRESRKKNKKRVAALMQSCRWRVYTDKERRFLKGRARASVRSEPGRHVPCQLREYTNIVGRISNMQAGEG